jgi:hypothetical protein
MLANTTTTTDTVQAERARIAELSRIVTQARLTLPHAIADDLHASAIAYGWSADAMRSALFQALVQGADRPRPSIQGPDRSGQAVPSDPNDPAAVRDAMAEAIAVRSMNGYIAASPRHAEFLGLRPIQMAEHLLRLRGQGVPSRDPLVIAERALTTTADFPALLAAAANKMLLAGYQPARPTYRSVFRRRDFRNFKPHHHLRLGDFPALMPLAEGGEIQVGTISESQETLLLSTFARRVRVTRQMLVNDDLGAFTDFAAMIGRRIADFENATAYGVVNTANGDGPTLLTGNAPVFATSAARANKAVTGTVLDLPNLAAGRAAIMKQRNLDGMPIAIGDRMRLLIGPNQELAARQLTVAVTPNEVSRENVYAGMIEPIVDPLIPTNRWYLLADPETAPVFVYGFLEGATGPQVATGPIQGVDGVEISVVFDFGVGAVDWRGGWFNPGV